MDPNCSSNAYVYPKGHEPHTNALLLPYIERYARKCDVQSILDLGCGNGTLARDMTAFCPTLVGLDASQSGIEEARTVCPQGTFYHMSFADPPEQVAESGFDMAVSTEVIEHLFQPRLLPQFAHAKLKPGGLFIVSTPYHGWLKNVAISVLGKWDHHHTVFWDGGHIKFWSRATLTRLLEEEGFTVEGFHGCGRLPFLWESMLLVARKR